MVFLAFILGLLIGSFLNVCIFRIPLNKSIVFPSSHCTSCSSSLKAIDLIPVFSYVMNRGRCRYCSSKISTQYPIIEFLNGITYMLLFINFGASIEFLKYALLCSVLIVVFAIDYYHQIIPDGLNLFLFASGIILLGIENINNPRALLTNLLGLLLAGGFFLLIAIISKGAMGGGDIKLMAVLGFWFGIKEVVLITFLSFLIGGILSLVFILLKLKEKKDFIPFGPFIVVATIATIFYGGEIINWYFSTFSVL
ncbi:prepilin peptidase [Alkaliphilus pronyensis]|uniref:Prepilin leader peptidase/N-methyltransferase n=1 Tax=Alkaliphilus pronyensis TaxID=1482732 RepID=A0A6I0F382_9FIRM|nr:A24 family peptidase [Alkaliphilus pronyensis]KAB3537361.1 prepilin peptidase [Alkaliphilus pronyensis]